MKNPTPLARETAERILQMQLDRTNASLTVRSLPDVIQCAMDQHLANSLKSISAQLDIIDLPTLYVSGLDLTAQLISNIKTKMQNLSK